MNHCELWHTRRPAFRGLARVTKVGALGDIQTPATPIGWPGSFDVHRTRPVYRPSSTYVRHVLGSCWLPAASSYVESRSGLLACHPVNAGHGADPRVPSTCWPIGGSARLDPAQEHLRLSFYTLPLNPCTCAHNSGCSLTRTQCSSLRGGSACISQSSAGQYTVPVME
jgi:hypothetical protein